MEREQLKKQRQKRLPTSPLDCLPIQSSSITTAKNYTIPKSTFKKAIRKKDKTDTRLMAAMYLLTADQILWNKVKGNIRESRIDYDEVRLDTVSENCYTLYSASKDMYFNTDHVSLSDIFDTKLISEKMYNVIITAINIRRLGLEKAEAIEYAI